MAHSPLKYLFRLQQTRAEFQTSFLNALSSTHITETLRLAADSEPEQIPLCAVPPETMSAEPCLWPRQSYLHGEPSATPRREAARDSHEISATRACPCESRSDNDVQLRGLLWLAELGKPQTVRIYHPMNSSLDVLETGVGVGRRLRWSFFEKEFAIYDSPYSQYSDWLEICPIVKGRWQLTNIPALKGKGQHFTCPLGVAPGSMLQQLATENIAVKKQD